MAGETGLGFLVYLIFAGHLFNNFDSKWFFYIAMSWNRFNMSGLRINPKGVRVYLQELILLLL